MSCVSGCECPGTDIDAAVTARESLHRIHLVAGLTQSAACHVRFDVLPETSSGGHKFKVSQITVRAEEREAGSRLRRRRRGRRTERRRRLSAWWGQ